MGPQPLAPRWVRHSPHGIGGCPSEGAVSRSPRMGSTRPLRAQWKKSPMEEACQACISSPPTCPWIPALVLCYNSSCGQQSVVCATMCVTRAKCPRELAIEARFWCLASELV
ncbi:hypothetical protein NDU88_005615 [Pleurodeles waltl]|uniref:Uncharacterized protein n=1 Tax=Pleurodeles waltl TaxID=8319 RepID=A0AAV7LLP6_PLEWA|nr:hypothetical protein NDU88_005615 [Pleurodeles waltl]